MTCAVDLRLPNYLRGDGTKEFLPYHLPYPVSAYRNSGGRFRGAGGRLWVMASIFCSVWTPPGAGRSGRYCGRPSVDVYLQVRSNRPAGCAADAALRPGRPQAQAKAQFAKLARKWPFEIPVGRDCLSGAKFAHDDLRCDKGSKARIVIVRWRWQSWCIL